MNKNYKKIVSLVGVLSLLLSSLALGPSFAADKDVPVPTFISITDSLVDK